MLWKMQHFTSNNNFDKTVICCIFIIIVPLLRSTY